MKNKNQTEGQPRKAKQRTLESCLVEVRRKWPNLPRSKRRDAAKMLLFVSQIEALEPTQRETLRILFAYFNNDPKADKETLVAKLREQLLEAEKEAKKKAATGEPRPRGNERGSNRT